MTSDDTTGAHPTIGEVLAQMAPPKGVVAVGVVHRDRLAEPEVLTTGRDARAEMFELGSVTKTLTATLLATLLLDGTLSPTTTVGEVMGDRAGPARHATLEQLVTHTSGMPRLVPGMMRPPYWPRDPYRFMTPRRFWTSLSKVDALEPGAFEYSNAGFDLLALVMAKAAGGPYHQLLTERVLRPAGMTTARCQPCSKSGLVRGHGTWMLNGRRWHDPIQGGGGVDVSIHDLVAWASANLVPESTPLDRAVRLAHEIRFTNDDMSIGLAWVHTDGVMWHNGATGGFQNCVAIGPDRAAAAIASHSIDNDYVIDDAVKRLASG